jgi:hypothetical protein
MMSCTKTFGIDGAGHKQRDVADLAGPGSLHYDAIEIKVRMLSRASGNRPRVKISGTRYKLLHGLLDREAAGLRARGNFWKLTRCCATSDCAVTSTKACSTNHRSGLRASVGCENAVSHYSAASNSGCSFKCSGYRRGRRWDGFCSLPV